MATTNYNDSNYLNHSSLNIQTIFVYLNYTVIFIICTGNKILRYIKKVKLDILLKCLEFKNIF